MTISNMPTLITKESKREKNRINLFFDCHDSNRKHTVGNIYIGYYLTKKKEMHISVSNGAVGYSVSKKVIDYLEDKESLRRGVTLVFTGLRGTERYTLREFTKLSAYEKDYIHDDEGYYVYMGDIEIDYEDTTYNPLLLFEER